jgi:hypothetical protein
VLHIRDKNHATPTAVIAGLDPAIHDNVPRMTTARMPVAEVDHGSDTASATARPSAAREKCLRSNAAAFIEPRLSLQRHFHGGDSGRPNFLCPDN